MNLRQQLVRSLAEDGVRPVQLRPTAPADRHMLMAILVGKITGICKGYSMPEDANHAMRDVCDALIEYRRECAASFEAENGPFASTFAVYAQEARDNIAEMEKAKERWEISC